MPNDIVDFDYCTQTIALKNTVETGFLSLGERLMTIRDKRLYEPQWQSFGEFVGELKISEGGASKLINIYKKFVLEYNLGMEPILKAGGWHVVSECLPVIKSKEDAVEWLQKAEVLSRDDLRKEIKEARSGIPMAICEHIDHYDVRICRTCGDKIQIHEEIQKNISA